MEIEGFIWSNHSESDGSGGVSRHSTYEEVWDLPVANCRFPMRVWQFVGSRVAVKHSRLNDLCEASLMV